MILESPEYYVPYTNQAVFVLRTYNAFNYCYFQLFPSGEVRFHHRSLLAEEFVVKTVSYTPTNFFQYIEFTRFKRRPDGIVKAKFNHYLNLFGWFSIWIGWMSFEIEGMQEDDYELIRCYLLYNIA